MFTMFPPLIFNSPAAKTSAPFDKKVCFLPNKVSPDSVITKSNVPDAFVVPFIAIFPFTIDPNNFPSVLTGRVFFNNIL
ncbi:hypothetical protein D3C87_1687320 [compost metagenome]